VIPEAENRVAFAFEECCSVQVGSAVGVLSAVRFDDQLSFLTDEICNERTNGLLAPKFGAFQLAVSQR
jgi:hypothetical protein